MDLDAAITEFERRRGKKYSAADRRVITETCSELGAEGFAVRPDGEIVSDREDIVHIHPTMIVARHQFKGSVKRDTFYPHFVYFRALDNWVDRSGFLRGKGAADEVTCPKCFMTVPRGSECTRDGSIH